MACYPYGPWKMWYFRRLSYQFCSLIGYTIRPLQFMTFLPELPNLPRGLQCESQIQIHKKITLSMGRRTANFVAPAATYTLTAAFCTPSLDSGVFLKQQSLPSYYRTIIITLPYLHKNSQVSLILFMT